jgi:hypothetical protein
MSQAFMDKCWLLLSLESELLESGDSDLVAFAKQYEYAFTLALATNMTDIPLGLPAVEKIVNNLWDKVIEQFNIVDQDFGDNEIMFLQELGLQ